MRGLSRGGITLMELIAILVVTGIAIPVLFSMWATISWQSVRSEGIADAAFYAEETMEEVRAKRFDENTTLPFSSTLGRDGAEASTNASTYDDVDDFLSTTDTNITSPAPGYSRSVTVERVNLTSANTWNVCPAVTCASSVTTCIPCSECCYKRIAVTVSRIDNSVTNVSLTTIVSGY